MPTSTDYDRWADRLHGLSDHLLGLDARLDRTLDPTRLSGGTVGPLVARTVDATTTNLAASRGHLLALTDACRQRAELCRRWSRALDAYDEAMHDHVTRARTLDPGDHLGPPPTRPTAPGPWAQRD
ncbi:MAG: hypothetical protein AAGD33_14570 [Actinomycetota bacterium]